MPVWHGRFGRQSDQEADDILNELSGDCGTVEETLFWEVGLLFEK